MKWPDVVLGELMDQDTSVIRIDDPANEKFITIRLYGLGVIERRIGAGKTPKPSSGYRVRAGQFVYSRIDARNGAYGIVPEGLDGSVCSKDFPVFDHRKDRVCLKYLLYMVCSDGFRRRVQDLSFGATNRQRVKEEEFLRLTIPLPPLPEQRRIAAILDHADALRAKRRETIMRFDELSQSAFHSMFGDPVENAKGLPVVPLIDLIDPERPLTYGILKPGPDQPGGVPYVRVVDIKGGMINEGGLRRTTEQIAHQYRRSRLVPGDLLMSIRGHVGRMAIVQAGLEGANITQDTARLALVGADVRYVRACLETAQFRRWMDRRTKGVAVRGINLGDLKTMPIPLPSTESQQRFAAVVEQLRARHESGRLALPQLESLNVSLKARAFRGEL